MVECWLSGRVLPADFIVTACMILILWQGYLKALSGKNTSFTVRKRIFVITLVDNPVSSFILRITAFNIFLFFKILPQGNHHLFFAGALALLPSKNLRRWIKINSTHVMGIVSTIFLYEALLIISSLLSYQRGNYFEIRVSQFRIIAEIKSISMREFGIGTA